MDNNDIKYYKNQSKLLKDETGIQFIDPLFPPDQKESISGKYPSRALFPNSTIDYKDVEWKRLSSCFSDYNGLFDELIFFNSFSGDFYGKKSPRKNSLITAPHYIVADTLLKVNPHFIIRLFRLDRCNYETGYYELNFFLDNQWKIVIIDDYIPIFKGTENPVFYQPTERNELWMCLIEKAWAKINGGYLNLFPIEEKLDQDKTLLELSRCFLAFTGIAGEFFQNASDVSIESMMNTENKRRLIFTFAKVPYVDNAFTFVIPVQLTNLILNSNRNFTFLSNVYNTTHRKWFYSYLEKLFDFNELSNLEKLKYLDAGSKQFQIIQNYEYNVDEEHDVGYFEELMVGSTIDKWKGKILDFVFTIDLFDSFDFTKNFNVKSREPIMLRIKAKTNQKINITLNIHEMEYYDYNKLIPSHLLIIDLTNNYIVKGEYTKKSSLSYNSLKISSQDLLEGNEYIIWAFVNFNQSYPLKTGNNTDTLEYLIQVEYTLNNLEFIETYQDTNMILLRSILYESFIKQKANNTSFNVLQRSNYKRLGIGYLAFINNSSKDETVKILPDVANMEIFPKLIKDEFTIEKASNVIHLLLVTTNEDNFNANFLIKKSVNNQSIVKNDLNTNIELGDIHRDYLINDFFLDKNYMTQAEIYKSNLYDSDENCKKILEKIYPDKFNEITRICLDSKKAFYLKFEKYYSERQFQEIKDSFLKINISNLKQDNNRTYQQNQAINESVFFHSCQNLNNYEKNDSEIDKSSVSNKSRNHSKTDLNNNKQSLNFQDRVTNTHSRVYASKHNFNKSTNGLKINIPSLEISYLPNYPKTPLKSNFVGQKSTTHKVAPSDGITLLSPRNLEQNPSWVEKNFDNGMYLGQVDCEFLFNGQGAYYWDSGEKYLGHWKDGERHGYGIQYVDSDYVLYEGEFNIGLRNGFGKLFLANDDYYIGEFKSDVFDGKGTYFWSNGASWTGKFKAGKLHGKGILNLPNGKTLFKEFKQGFIKKRDFQEDDDQSKQRLLDLFP